MLSLAHTFEATTTARTNPIPTQPSSHPHPFPSSRSCPCPCLERPPVLDLFALDVQVQLNSDQGRGPQGVASVRDLTHQLCSTQAPFNQLRACLALLASLSTIHAHAPTHSLVFLSSPLSFPLSIFPSSFHLLSIFFSSFPLLLCSFVSLFRSLFLQHTHPCPAQPRLPDFPQFQFQFQFNKASVALRPCADPCLCFYFACLGLDSTGMELELELELQLRRACVRGRAGRG
ncbi:hypothetical protein C8R47DRAFT_614767 [Mycena vitilis]|nr:hypothetical protein C8R47DRAFT_614767 [Mycena vitilis]